MSDKLLSQEELDALFWITDRPKTVGEAQMDARLQDYLELCEQAFIAGWTDCEENILAGEYKTDAYYNGYHQSMKLKGERND
jgi:hypothetical protein